MKLHTIGTHQTELETEKARILFSYDTPVAAYLYDEHQYIRTSKRWSNTTTKHINTWLNDSPCLIVPQDVLDELKD